MTGEKATLAVVAALAHVDVAPGQLHRRVRLHTLDRLGGGPLEEERNDLDKPADQQHT